jgi:hypothetical protein
MALVGEDGQQPRSPRLGFTGTGAGSAPHLAAQAKQIICTEMYAVSG